MDRLEIIAAIVVTVMAVVTAALLMMPYSDVTTIGFDPKIWNCTHPGYGDPVCIKKDIKP